MNELQMHTNGCVAYYYYCYININITVIIIIIVTKSLFLVILVISNINKIVNKIIYSKNNVY